ncbi:MAG TPA: hypothetical protein VK508_19770 [Cyclobacteriaceae bacterium]|nr:hypothetical protein [Cyclobacteriaceae bacterium]
MKISPVLTLILLALLSSCGSSKPDLSKPAMTGIATPVFEGMVAAMSGNVYAMLPPLKTVYVLSDSMKVMDQNYVKVWWNDSSGYVPAGWVMPGFRKGVHYTAIDPALFADEQRTISTSYRLSDWQLVAVGETKGTSTQIIYELDGKPAIGYVEEIRIFLDSTDLAFYDAYQETNGDVNEIEALKTDAKYEASLVRRVKLGDATVDDATPWLSKEDKPHSEPEWFSNNERLDPSEYPGTFALHYVFTDSSLSEINHFGDTLANGYISCIKGLFAEVARYKLVFTPSQNMDFAFEAVIEDDRQGIMGHEDFAGAVAGQTYTFFISDDSYDSGCDPITFSVVTKNGYVGRGSIGGECGD